MTNVTFTTFVVSDSFNALTAVPLEEFVTYAIYIRASTRIGTGPSSDPITETTHQARKFPSKPFFFYAMRSVQNLLLYIRFNAILFKNVTSIIKYNITRLSILVVRVILI